MKVIVMTQIFFKSQQCIDDSATIHRALHNNLYNFARRVGTCELHVRGTKKQLGGLRWVTQRTCDPRPLGRQAMRRK